MPFCRTCGLRISESASYCPTCGARTALQPTLSARHAPLVNSVPPASEPPGTPATSTPPPKGKMRRKRRNIGLAVVVVLAPVFIGAMLWDHYASVAASTTPQAHDSSSAMGHTPTPAAAPTLLAAAQSSSSQAHSQATSAPITAAEAAFCRNAQKLLQTLHHDWPILATGRENMPTELAIERGENLWNNDWCKVTSPSSRCDQMCSDCQRLASQYFDVCRDLARFQGGTVSAARLKTAVDAVMETESCVNSDAQAFAASVGVSQ